MEMTAAIQYILTAAQSLGSQDYYKKSRKTTLGLAGVFAVHNVCSVHRGIFSTLGCSVHWGNTMSTLGDVQYIGGIS